MSHPQIQQNINGRVSEVTLRIPTEAIMNSIPNENGKRNKKARYLMEISKLRSMSSDEFRRSEISRSLVTKPTGSAIHDHTNFNAHQTSAMPTIHSERQSAHGTRSIGGKSDQYHTIQTRSAPSHGSTHTTSKVIRDANGNYFSKKSGKKMRKVKGTRNHDAGYGAYSNCNGPHNVCRYASHHPQSSNVHITQAHCSSNTHLANQHPHHGSDVHVHGHHPHGSDVHAHGHHPHGSDAHAYGRHPHGSDVHAHGHHPHGSDAHAHGRHPHGSDVHAHGHHPHGSDAHVHGHHPGQLNTHSQPEGVRHAVPDHSPAGGYYSPEHGGFHIPAAVPHVPHAAMPPQVPHTSPFHQVPKKFRAHDVVIENGNGYVPKSYGEIVYCQPNKPIIYDMTPTYPHDALHTWVTKPTTVMHDKSSSSSSTSESSIRSKNKSKSASTVNVVKAPTSVSTEVIRGTHPITSSPKLSSSVSTPPQVIHHASDNVKVVSRDSSTHALLPQVTGTTIGHKTSQHITNVSSGCHSSSSSSKRSGVNGRVRIHYPMKVSSPTVEYGGQATHHVRAVRPVEIVPETRSAEEPIVPTRTVSSVSVASVKVTSSETRELQVPHPTPIAPSCHSMVDHHDQRYILIPICDICEEDMVRATRGQTCKVSMNLPRCVHGLRPKPSSTSYEWEYCTSSRCSSSTTMHLKEKKPKAKKVEARPAPIKAVAKPRGSDVVIPASEVIEPAIGDIDLFDKKWYYPKPYKNKEYIR